MDKASNVSRYPGQGSGKRCRRQVNKSQPKEQDKHLRGYGVVVTDPTGRIRYYLEKPDHG